MLLGSCFVNVCFWGRKLRVWKINEQCGFCFELLFRDIASCSEILDIWIIEMHDVLTFELIDLLVDNNVANAL